MMMVHILPLILKPIISPLLIAVIALRLDCLLFLLLLRGNHFLADPLIGHQVVGQLLFDLINAAVMSVVDWLVFEMGLISVG